MTCKQCKSFEDCKDNAFVNGAKFDPNESVEYCTGFEPITNADRIRAMSDEVLAEWLSALAYGRDTPWSDQFKRKYCDNCPSEMYKIKETGKVLRLYECDFADGKCPHGSDIVWWLQQPAGVE